MDELNKQQIVLLTLLISFVTSIATGITTVSLVTQMETPTVTQTINRVVEKTIEKVVPENNDAISISKTPEKEVVTVVVNEEDLTVDSVSTNSKSLVRIYQAGRSGSRSFVALAAVVTDSGIVIANESFFSRSRDYIGVYHDGEYEMEAIYQSGDDNIIAMKPITEGLEQEPSFSPVTFASTESIQLGQTVISLGGQEKDTVSTGIVNSIDTDSTGNIKSVTTSIADSSILGTIFINLKGEVLGMNIGSLPSTRMFTTSNILETYVERALNGS